MFVLTYSRRLQRLSLSNRAIALCQFSTDDTSGKSTKDRTRWPTNKEAQRNWYKHDNDVNLIIRTTSEAELKNAADKN